MGFWRGMSSTTPLCAVVDTIEEANTSNKELHLVFMDCKKAFDSIKHEAMLTTLRNYGVGKQFANLISELYSNSNTHFILNEEHSNNFSIACGV
jgi:RNA-binding protein YlmH